MLGNSRAVRVARTAALLVGLLVLVLSVISTVTTGRLKEVAAQDDGLKTTLSQQVAALESYFERSRTIDAVLAHNPVFTDFYRAPGTTQQKITAGGPLLDRVNDALGFLEQLYPGRIGEACFIDSSGSEIARVVDGVAAAPADLSQDEANNPFFAPTFALGAGGVYQAAAYESPDTHDQVISNSTVISAAGHSALVHFEITLDSFRMPSAGGLAASIVDAGTGLTLVDSRRPTATGPGTDRSLETLRTTGAASGLITVGPRRVAYQRLATETGNANQWYVAVSAPAFGQGWTRGVGVGSLALLLGALLTILISGVSWAGHLRAVRRSALHDGLTGLPNRALFAERVHEALCDDRRGAAPVTVLIIDLDRFREVNDMFGHRCGDLLLQQAAGRLSARSPAGSTVARFGADTFAVLAPVGAAGPETAERLLAALHETFAVEGLSIDLEASVGLAGTADPGAEPEELLRHAETAMFLAKQHNSGWESHDTEQPQLAPKRLALLGDLRRALEDDEQLILYYQPKVSLGGGELVGVEALIRWQHPQRGWLAPDAFIPVAETTGLIQALTTRVLELAVAQARTWLDRGLRIPVAVNLSTRCLLDLTLPDRVLDLLSRSGLPPDLIELEITESTVIADPARALRVLAALHEAGITLSVDDYGTGHSSMAYLQRLPVDELKIDRSFVQQMAIDGNTVLVQSAIALGHNLGFSVVAEGVEDEHTLTLLGGMGCDIAQGYHLGRPMPAADLDGWLARRAAPAPLAVTADRPLV